MKQPFTLAEPTLCPCGHPSCAIYQFNGAGNFYVGCGFTKEVADEIRKRVNAHFYLVTALAATARELARLRTVYLPQYTDKVGEPDLEVLNNALDVLDAL